MYKIAKRSHPLLSFLALGAGITAAVYFPHMYPDQLVEIPIVGLYFLEIGLALLLTLLFYENASSKQIVRLSAVCLGLSMMVGAVGNFAAGHFGRQTQFLPDSFVLISWIELVVMNLTGVLATVSLFRLARPSELERPKRTTSEEPAPHTDDEELDDFAPPMDIPAPIVSAAAPVASASAAESGESAKDILEGLDISRINRLEKSLRPKQVSLENLFKDDDEMDSVEAVHAISARSSDDIAVVEESIEVEEGTKSDTAKASPQKAVVPEKPAAAAAKSGDSAIKTMRGVRIDDLKKDSPKEPAALKADALDEEGDIDLGALLRGLKEEIAAPPSGKGETPSGMSRFQQLLRGELMDEHAVDLEDTYVAPPDTVTGSVDQDSAVFDEVGSELDDIFAKLVPQEAQMDFSEALSSLKQKRAAAKSKEDEEEDYEDAEDDDEEIHDDVIAAKATEEKVVPVPQEPTEVKEFGRLSGEKSQKHSHAEETGTMKTIGKMLLDAQAVENIIKAGARGGSGLRRARVLSETQGRDIEGLLDSVDRMGGTQGSVVVGHDGLLMSSTLKEASDKDLLGTMSLGIYNNANLAVQKLEMGHLHQIVLHSGGNITVLTEVGEGVMGVFADTQEKGKLNSLIKSIKDAIEGESEDDAPDMVPETFDAEPAEEARAPIALATMPKPAKPVDEAKAKAAEEARLKAIEEAKAKAAEQARLAAEAQKKKEEKASVEGRSSFESVLAEGKIGDLSIDSIFGDLDDAQPVQNGSALEEPPVVALGPALDPDEITTMVISGKSALEKKSRELPKEEEDEVLSLGPAPIKDDDVVALGPVSAPEDDVVSLGSAPIPEPPAAKKKSVMDIVGVSERTTDEVLDKKAPEPEKAESTTKAVAADQIRDLLESLASSQSLPAVPVEEKVVAKDSKPVEKEVKPVEKEVKVAEKEVKAPEKKVEVDSDEETSEADDESRPEAKEVKEFGRLSAAASVSKETDTVGSMKTIGKMLIDAQAISNIIKAGENTTRGLTTARVISAARGEGIRSLLAQVDNYPGVVGSLIVGHDGLVIASTLPPSMDKDTLGALSIAMHSNANVATKKLELGTLQQLVCQCNDKATVLTEVDVGILCVFSDSWETTKLDGLIAAIDKTIKG